MAAHKVVVATWEILDGEGLRRRRFFGDVVDVDEAEAARGIAAGALAEVDEAPADDQDDEAAVLEWLAAEDQWKADAAEWLEAEKTWREGAQAAPTDQSAPIETTPTPAGEVEKPKKTAKVEAWRDYAVAQGLDADEVKPLTKEQLIELVGG